MRAATLRLAAAALFAAASMPPALAGAADVQQEARSALYFYGRGYARAALEAVPVSARAPGSGMIRTVPLPNGEMQVQRADDAGHVTVEVLKLSRGDVPELGLQVGVTPVDTLIGAYGRPESQDARHLVYRGISEICLDHLVFHIRRGVLQAIEWDWCYD